jgi:hypothetical protein
VTQYITHTRLKENQIESKNTDHSNGKIYIVEDFMVTSSLPVCVQYGGGKELATLPHSTPGLVRLTVVV